MHQKSYLRKYNSKIASTKGRIDKLGNPIEFKLSFEQYCELWYQYGRHPGHPYVISRIDDVGHYEIGNVFIQHTIGNVTDALGIITDLDRKINIYAINNNYSRRTVRNLIKNNQIQL